METYWPSLLSPQQLFYGVMHSKAGMWHHVGSTMKIVRNTLFVVGGKGEKGRLRTILLVTAIAATQEGGSPSQHHATFAW